jgi:iron(III) transport system substrate-binding protein
MKTRILTWLASAAMIAMAAPAQAQGQLNMICAPQIEWCQALAVAFEKKTGTKVAVTQKSTGEILAQVRAEKDNPKLDIWFGGTTDPHIVAAEENLSDEYTPPLELMAQQHSWAQDIWAITRKRTVGISIGSIGFGFNTELLARKGIAAPACWADLVKPIYKNEIQIANPNSSGTAYIVIATLVQLMGEDKAFDYLKQMHANVNAYTRSGVAPIKAAARGETGVSVSFMMDIMTEKNAKFPVDGNNPCEGTGYEVAGMSIIKGARNRTEARKFYDWYMTAEAQELGAKPPANQFHGPANKTATLDPRIPDLSKAKLIKYDFAKYGSSAERKRLLDKWDREISSLPR